MFSLIGLSSWEICKFLSVTKNSYEIIVYKSQNYLVTSLLEILKGKLSTNFIITGDFNFHYNGPDTNCLTRYLASCNFKQIILKSTQKEGNITDHFHVCKQRFSPSTTVLYHPLYSIMIMKLFVCAWIIR